MCGIIGYTGKQQALPILIEGLKRMEYRGYDSAGVAVLGKNRVSCTKAVGKIAGLEQKIGNGNNLAGSLGIGHCLHPSTVIQLADGTTSMMRDLINGQKVVNMDTSTHRIGEGMIQVLRHRTPSVLYRIITPLSSFIATEEHKTLVYTKDGIGEKHVNDLTIGDFLPFPRKRILSSFGPFDWMGTTQWTAIVS